MNTIKHEGSYFSDDDVVCFVCEENCQIRVNVKTGQGIFKDAGGKGNYVDTWCSGSKSVYCYWIKK